MKTIAIIVAVCLVAFVKAEAEDFVEAAKNMELCYKEIGITEGISELTESQEKCAVACLMKALNIINADGSVNHEVILKNSQNLSAEQLDEIVKTCQTEAGDVNNKDYYCGVAVCLQKNHDILNN